MALVRTPSDGVAPARGMSTAPIEVNAACAPSVCGPALAGDDMLAQCLALVDQLSDERYQAESRVLPGGTVGKHLRHVLDHFVAALDALEGGLGDQPDGLHTHADAPSGGGESRGVIDYDHRRRATPVETCRTTAKQSIVDVRHRLMSVSELAGGGRVRVWVMLSGDGRGATLDSTLARELAFAAHHGTHHCAMIGAICREHGLDVPTSFGKAPSTLNYERTIGMDGGSDCAGGGGSRACAR